MATIKDIAKLLVEKHKMTMGVADDFLQNMVEVINEGLLQDRIVKIKGFGTFKLQEVKERSSVNVNTGERVVIAAHDKITFTPDAVMRDLINKPFAQFETVIIDGNDTSAPKKEEEKVEEKVEEKPVEKVAETPVVKEEPQPIEEPKVEEEPQEEPQEEETSSKLKYIVAGIICAVILCVVGYFVSTKMGDTQTPQNVEVAKAQPKETEKEVQDTLQANVQEPQNVEKAQDVQDDFDKYNKDARVKYGAYSIVGIDTIVTVYKGQTLKGISKAYLGPGMECYVEAFNETKEVKAGDKVRIPKLKVKKISKKNRKKE